MLPNRSSAVPHQTSSLGDCPHTTSFSTLSFSYDSALAKRSFYPPPIPSRSLDASSERIGINTFLLPYFRDKILPVATKECGFRVWDEVARWFTDRGLFGRSEGCEFRAYGSVLNLTSCIIETIRDGSALVPEDIDRASLYKVKGYTGIPGDFYVLKITPISLQNQEISLQYKIMMQSIIVMGRLTHNAQVWPELHQRFLLPLELRYYNEVILKGKLGIERVHGSYGVIVEYYKVVKPYSYPDSLEFLLSDAINIASSLHYLHTDIGVAHLDFKKENLCETSTHKPASRRTLLLDWGSAKPLEEGWNFGGDETKTISTTTSILKNSGILKACLWTPGEENRNEFVDSFLCTLISGDTPRSMYKNIDQLMYGIWLGDEVSKQVNQLRRGPAGACDARLFAIARKLIIAAIEPLLIHWEFRDLITFVQEVDTRYGLTPCAS